MAASDSSSRIHAEQPWGPTIPRHAVATTTVGSTNGTVTSTRTAVRGTGAGQRPGPGQGTTKVERREERPATR